MSTGPLRGQPPVENSLFLDPAPVRRYPRWLVDDLHGERNFDCAGVSRVVVLERPRTPPHLGQFYSRSKRPRVDLRATTWEHPDRPGGRRSNDYSLWRHTRDGAG